MPITCLEFVFYLERADGFKVNVQPLPNSAGACFTDAEFFAAIRTPCPFTQARSVYRTFVLLALQPTAPCTITYSTTDA